MMVRIPMFSYGDFPIVLEEELTREGSGHNSSLEVHFLGALFINSSIFESSTLQQLHF